MRFKVNICVPCVTNKMINGKQFTIGWYVDDLKVLHEVPDVVSDMIVYLKKFYERLPNAEVKAMEFQMLTACNKVLNYLGMDFDFTVKGQVSIYI